MANVQMPATYLEMYQKLKQYLIAVLIMSKFDIQIYDKGNK